LVSKSVAKSEFSSSVKGGSSKNFVDIDADPTLLEGSKCEVWKEDSKILEV
jgi:hypothetical protein